MTDRTKCPECDAPLPAGRLEGLCPACSWRLLSAEAGDSLLMLPGFAVIEEIARGGMGVVYRARQREPAREVAVKMLLAHQAGSADMVERFRTEALALAELDHPAILPIFQFGEHEGMPFFSMKLATGGTLAQRKGEFAGQWRKIAELVALLADAVQFAHERGVLHRDLKPGNILFDDQGRAYVSDFGLAKVISNESDLTRSADFLGTPHYVAPEVAARSARQATTASDVYSLGAILYELLTGRPPFEAEGIPALLRKIAEEEPMRPGAVGVQASACPGTTGRKDKLKLELQPPRDLEVICLKCLAKEPGARYGSARELAADLRRWLGGRTIVARRATRLERMRAWTRRNPVLAGAGAVLLVVLGAGVWLQAQANGRLQHALGESLLTQARLQRSSGRAGQRFETLALVARAANSAQDARAAALRTEVAGALALPDLRSLSRWPVHISHFENDFDFSADLGLYAGPMAGGGFAVFDTDTRQPVWQVQGRTNNPVVELRLSPLGRWVAAQFQDNTLELHSLTSNSLPRRWQSADLARWTFAFARGEDRFALAGFQNFKPQVQVLDLANNSLATTIIQKAPSTAIAFGARGTHLALAGERLAVWRLADTNELWSVPLSHHASALEWSPDGRQLAVAYDRRLKRGAEELGRDRVCIVDAATGREQMVFADAGSRVERLAFHPNGQSLAAACWEGEFIWGSTRREGFRLITEGAQRALTVGQDGQRLAYAPTRDQLGLLEVAEPTVLRDWPAPSHPARKGFALAVSSDGQWVATGTDDWLHLWNAETRTEIAAHELPARPWYLAVLFGPGDTFLYYSAFAFGVRKIELVRTNTLNGSPTLQFGREQIIGAPTGFLATGYGADGRSLIVGQYRRRSVNDRIPPTIWFWPEGDPAHARKLTEDFPLVGYREIAGGQWAISADLISPDAWIWNARTGERVRSLGIPLPVTCELTRNGQWIIARTREEFTVWEVGTWRRIARWPVRADEQGTAYTVASPDSRWLANGTPDGRITLRQLPAGNELVILPPPRRVQTSYWQFSPDKSRLFVLLESGEVLEWRLSELRQEFARLGLDWKD